MVRVRVRDMVRVVFFSSEDEKEEPATGAFSQ
jgi:hypothetical protein